MHTNLKSENLNATDHMGDTNLGTTILKCNLLIHSVRKMAQFM
jgi:hypothetical protein